MTESPGAVTPHLAPTAGGKSRHLDGSCKQSASNMPATKLWEVMGTVTIRNLDDQVIAALKAQAKENQRSLET
ncbi:MAG: hypothetical protein OXN89_11775 [Bryobacterales bacterium]|nr:hypothetical protein [Bryobacterales bacterium]